MNTEQNFDVNTKLGNWVHKRLNKIEIVLFLIAVLSISMRIGEIVSANLLLLISFSSLSILYFFRSLSTLKVGKIGAMDLFFEKLTFMGSSVGILGLLFGLLHFPGFHIMLIIGSATLILVTPVMIIKNSKNQEKEVFEKRTIIRSMLIGILGLLLLLASDDILTKLNL